MAHSLVFCQTVREHITSTLTLGRTAIPTVFRTKIEAAGYAVASTSVFAHNDSAVRLTSRKTSGNINHVIRSFNRHGGRSNSSTLLRNSISGSKILTEATLYAGHTALASIVLADHGEKPKPKHIWTAAARLSLDDFKDPLELAFYVFRAPR